MVHREAGGVAGELTRARSRFAAWRRTRAAGTRIPEPLWAVAVKLAGVHGLARVASCLGLDYYALKKRMQSAGPPVDDGPGFIELPPVLPFPSECVIELDDGSGSTMRIQVKGRDTPDVVSLVRHFWGAD